MVDVLKSLFFFVLSFFLSTILIRKGIPRLRSDNTLPQPLPESSSSMRIFDWYSTGFWIGLCETFLIFVLVYHQEYSALAIIIGAKEFVRKEEIRVNPSYYLLGTLINLCVAALFALMLKSVL